MCRQLCLDLPPVHGKPPESVAVYDACVFCVHDDWFDSELARQVDDVLLDRCVWDNILDEDVYGQLLQYLLDLVYDAHE